MPTPAERKALLFLTGLLLLGAGVRTHRALRDHPDPDPASRLALRRQLAAVDSVRAMEQARQARRAVRRKSDSPPVLTPGAVPVAGLAAPAVPAASGASASPIDLDVASAAEIERLPRIGPALAGRIIANRDSLGPFGSLEELQRVRGVGPAMAKTLAPHVTFSLSPRPSHVTERGSVTSTTAQSTRRRARGARPP
jgi:competence protein ComEA